MKNYQRNMIHIYSTKTLDYSNAVDYIRCIHCILEFLKFQNKRVMKSVYDRLGERSYETICKSLTRR